MSFLVLHAAESDGISGAEAGKSYGERGVVGRDPVISVVDFGDGRAVPYPFGIINSSNGAAKQG